MRSFIATAMARKVAGTGLTSALATIVPRNDAGSGRRSHVAGALLALATALALAAPASATGPITTLVSVSTSGQQGNDASGANSISADGRFVVFDSNATNLVPGDTNGAGDVFLRDRSAGTTTRVSVSTGGGQADCDSFPTDLSISADGRYVVFSSCADDLVPDDTNGAWDVFLRDSVAGTTKRISLSSTGRQSDADSFVDSISGNGGYVTFVSFADNLVRGDTNGTADIFRRDTLTGKTTRIDVSSDGTQADCDAFDSTISADGRYVLYDSCADNLVPGDTNGRGDVFLRDTVAGTTRRVSVAVDGTQANDDSYSPVISGDGSTAAFTSNATNLASAANANGHKADIFVVKLATGAVEVLSTNDIFHLGNHPSCCSKGLSDNGRYLVFRSYASNLVKGDTNKATDVFLVDRATGTIGRVSVSASGEQSNGDSANAMISGDGRWAVFVSFGSNLVPGDTNGTWDTFVRGPLF